jgi:hypothetical protein
LNSNRIKQGDLKNRKFAGIVVSNNNAVTGRDDFFHLLNRHRKVDSGGNHLNNIGSNVSDKISFIRDYKFNIAFENSSYKGYTTEKIVDAFVARTVPIYYGNPNISYEFNPKSFINAHSFTSQEELIDYIKLLDYDDDRYLNTINEPIIVDESNVPKEQDLKKFLFSIFDQDIKNAKRRPHSLRSIRKEFYLKLLYRIVNFYYGLPIIIRSLLKPFRPRYK